MVVRTAEKDVPSEFRPARLFLDDIKEIVGILRELVQSQKPVAIPTKEEPKFQVIFSTGGKECDDILDLPKIFKSNRELSIEVKKGWNRTFFLIRPWIGTRWWAMGLTKEDTWSAYHQLEALIEKRKSQWKGLLHYFPSWLLLILGSGAGGGAVFVFVAVHDFLLKIVPPLAVYAALFLVAGIFIIGVLAGARHTTLILRNSWDPSPLFNYFKDKLIPVTVGAMIGLIGTLLGLYLKHKYWP